MKKILFGFWILVSLIVMSCSDYLDVNDNPNDVVESTPEYTLAAALNATSQITSHHEIGAFWGGQWSPSGSVSGFVPEKTYDITTGFRNEIWNALYDNLTDYVYVENKARAEGKRALVGMSLTMQAFCFQTLVDIYGNIPYTDALKGTNVIRPAYDDDSFIYDELAKKLDSARMHLRIPISGTNPSPGASDIYLAGDVSTWLKFANSLKLRLMLRQSGVASKATAVQDAIDNLAADPAGFLTTNVLCNPGYLKTSGKMNPFYDRYGFTSGNAKAGNHDFYVYSEFFIDNLVATNDTRISRLAYLPENTGFPNYRGVPFGEGSDDYLYSKVSGYGPAFLPTTAGAASSNLYARSQPIMLAAESYFLQAEAVERGLMAGTAQTLYQNGITASFTYLGLTSGQASTYYGQALEGVSYATSSDKLGAILVQKWVALCNVNGLEAWNEYRRTGYPDIPLSTRAGANPHPVRLLYPLSEYSTNSDNVNEQGTISQFTSKIFWDVN